MDFDDIVKIVDQVKVLEARLAVAEAEREKYQGLADNRLNCMALYRNLIGKHEARIGVLADKLNLAEAERDAARAGEARAVEALRKLANEADALRIEEYSIRELVGNTNWSCLRLRIDEARALDAQPALDWLTQQRAEAAAEALEKLATDLRQDPWGTTLHDVDSLRSILRTRAAALRAGEVGNG